VALRATLMHPSPAPRANARGTLPHKGGGFLARGRARVVARFPPRRAAPWTCRPWFPFERRGGF
jgi:hypothetical protein